jgi:hypothetical protein
MIPSKPDKKKKRRQRRQKKAAQDFITILATVEGLPQLAKAKPIEVRCCEGNQLIKWLSLTVSQRCCSQKPSGARRSYERSRTGNGFVVPGEVLACDADDPGVLSVVDPRLPIKEVFKPGHNKCIVRLGPTFGHDCLAKQNISAFGVPSTYLSPFAQRAFYSVTADKLQNYDALKERVEKKEEECNKLVTRWELERSLQKSFSQVDVDASKFRVAMVDQSGFAGDIEHRRGSMNVPDSAEQNLVLLETVEIAFEQMSMCRNDLISAADRKSLKHAVAEWLNLVDNVFKFYSGMGADSGTGTMSKSEFKHFIAGSKIFADVNRVQQHIDACFTAANEEDPQSAAAKKKAGGKDDNPDDDLMRFEFIECLIRLSQIRYSEAGLEAELMASSSVAERAAHAAENLKRYASYTGRPHALYSCTVLMHCTHALYSCTLLIHCTHALYSCTLLMHCTHALYSCTVLMHCTHALYSSTVLMHCTHALYSCTVLMHCTHALYSYCAHTCTHTALTLYSYCTHTVLILYSYLYSYCTHTLLLLCSYLYSYCAHTVLILYSYLYSYCTHTLLLLYSH